MPGCPVCVSLLLVTAYLFLFRQFLLFPCQVFSHFNSCPVEVVQYVDGLLPLGDTVAHPCVRVDNDFHWTLHRLFRWYSATSGIAVRVRLHYQFSGMPGLPNFPEKIGVPVCHSH